MAIAPILPIGPAQVGATPHVGPTAAMAQQRAVRDGVQALGGANNYAAQSSVQSRQDIEARKQGSQLIARKITTATLAALEPVGSAHDEDEADAERESEAFGHTGPYGTRLPPRKKK